MSNSSFEICLTLSVFDWLALLQLLQRLKACTGADSDEELDKIMADPDWKDTISLLVRCQAPFFPMIVLFQEDSLIGPLVSSGGCWLPGALSFARL